MSTPDKTLLTYSTNIVKVKPVSVISSKLNEMLRSNSDEKGMLEDETIKNNELYDDISFRTINTNSIKDDEDYEDFEL